MSYSKDTIVCQPIPTHPNVKDRTGIVVNGMTFLGLAGRNKYNRFVWYIQCYCGKIFVLRETSIIGGKTKSCGCLRVEMGKRTTHGMRHTPEYVSYHAARGRCKNPNVDSYHNYGGRGIEFRFTSFQEFFDEVGKQPTPEHTLDRINNDGHYEKGNVKWSLPLEQGNHKRNNHLITYNGRTQILSAWARELGVHPATIIDRIKRGWSEERAVTTPTQFPQRGYSQSAE